MVSDQHVGRNLPGVSAVSEPLEARAASDYGRPGGSAYACKFDEDGQRVLFIGPFGRVKAQLARGRIARDLEIGLRALQFPGNAARLRDTWELRYDKDRLELEFISPRGYVGKFRFFKPVPSQLLDALSDVFKRHRPAGTRAQERTELGRRARAAVRDAPTKIGGFIEKYRRLKAEFPDKFRALLTKARKRQR